jgi:diguanylate cyclase (GGDEF)-like protein/PAS domain S-box-containing protein
MAPEDEIRVPGPQPGEIAEVMAMQSALLEYATELLVFTGFEGQLVAAAGAGLGVLGFDGAGRRGHHIAEQIHPDDLIKTLDLVERARVEPNFDEVIEVRVRTVSGGWRDVEAHVQAVIGHEVLGTGAAIRVRATRPSVDDSDRTADDRFLSLAAELERGVLSADARGWVVYANDRAQEILGLSAETLSGDGWLVAVHPADRGDVEDVVEQAVGSARPLQAVFRKAPVIPPREGRPGGVDQDRAEAQWLSIRAVALDPDRRTGWVGILDDVTDRHRADASLAHQATHDPLTGLPNRSLLEDRLRQACTRLRQDDESVAVLFVDLDRIKEVNDTIGHSAGDAVLVATARRLSEGVRPGDTVGRLGGDEFVVVLEGADGVAAARVATELTDRLGEAVELTGAGPSSVAVSASIGVATASGAGVEPETLLADADAAMYRRKHARG